MCHNHSHFAAEIIGVLVVGETTFNVMSVSQPLTVELPFGERLILNAGMTLLLPVSRLVHWPPSRSQATEVCFIPSSYMAGTAMIITPITLEKLSTLGTSHETFSSAGDASPEIRTDGDDDVPW